MRRLLCTLLAFFVLAVATPVARGDPAASGLPCAERSALKAVLAQRWQERPTAFGMASNGRVLELYTSPEGQSWTLVAVAPEGRACVIASGRGWIERPATRTIRQGARA